MNLIHDARHLYTHFRIDGIKAMLPGISGGKQVICQYKQLRPCLFIISKEDKYINCHAKITDQV